MSIDLKTLLAPFVGVGVAWLAGKGVVLTPDQAAALTAVLAGGLTAAAHLIHVHKASTPNA